MKLKIENKWLRYAFIGLAIIWIIIPDPIPVIDDIVLAYLVYKQFQV